MLIKYWISPPKGSKKVVLKFLSVNNIVIAPPNTGKDNTNNHAVIKTAQTNNGILNIVIPGILIFNTVTIKFIEPNIEEIPAKCKLKIAHSIDAPECAKTPDKGGYKVHPVPAPISTTEDQTNKKKDGINNQKLILFKRGNAISGAPIIKGKNQLPKPPIKAGITIKKIIIKACAVIITL